MHFRKEHIRTTTQFLTVKSQFIEQLKVENGKLKFNKISVCRPVHGMHPVGVKPLSTPGAGTESPNFLPSKTAVFSSKPAGEDTASPLQGLCGFGKQFDKREFEDSLRLHWER